MARAKEDPEHIVCCGETNSDPRLPMALFSSHDGGLTWTRIRITSQTGCGNAIALDPKDSRCIYVGGRKEGKTAVFKTDDAGTSWKEITGPIMGVVAELALDPRTSQTVLAGTPNGLFRSKNGGTSWERRARFDVRVIKFDTVSPDRIWAGGEDGLFVSVDGGTRWTREPGLTIDEIICLEFDPKKRILFAGTDGGGLVAGTVGSESGPAGRKR